MCLRHTDIVPRNLLAGNNRIVSTSTAGNGRPERPSSLAAAGRRTPACSVDTGMFACGRRHLLGPPASLPAPACRQGCRRSQAHRPVHELSSVYVAPIVVMWDRIADQAEAGCLVT